MMLISYSGCPDVISLPGRTITNYGVARNTGLLRDFGIIGSACGRVCIRAYAAAYSVWCEIPQGWECIPPNNDDGVFLLPVAASRLPFDNCI